MRPDRRLIDRLEIEHPIFLAPMAGSGGVDLAVAVSEAGGLGALPCAGLEPDEARADFLSIRLRTARPVNMNFFCHRAPASDDAGEARWRARLAPYYAELGVPIEEASREAVTQSFGEALCRVVEEVKPNVASFHFGLPDEALVRRVKATGAFLIASATTVPEARWLEQNGCDAVIAQGSEAGGHRGMFLTSDPTSQAGTMALVPQVVDAVSVPVIAAGGISDARGIAAAFMLGASAVQMGTAFLLTPEALVSAPHREALRTSRSDSTALTNVFSGRPARGVVNRLIRETGPMAGDAPAFPFGFRAYAPLRAAAEARGSGDFTALWSGQSAALAREMPAGDLVRKLAAEARALLG